jgi:REP element-mobilizing transposase RayT
LRVHIPGGFYHATLRGNHQQDIFRTESDRQLLNAIVARAIEAYDASVHAYCWMTNHLHFLMQVGERPLGDVMRHIASGYARAFQQKLTTTGHLFERRYHANIVDVDSYLLELLRYIHLNPVRAKLVSRAADYRWSSHGAYAGAVAAEPWLTTRFALDLFGRDAQYARAAYLHFMESTPDMEFEAPLPMSEAIATGRPPLPARSAAPPGLAVRQTLAQLLDEACQRFAVREADLSSPSRDPLLVQVRAWVAQEALDRRISTLSEVARALGRDRATLRSGMRLYRDQGK